MHLRRLVHAILPLAILAVAATGAAGCRIHHVRGPSRAALLADDGVRIRVQGARARGNHVIVKTSIMNQSPEPVVLRRSELGIRLADGSMLPPPRGRDATPIVVGPGEYRTVKVRFPSRRGVDLTDARLVIGAVDYAGGVVQNAGELALRGEGRTLVLGPAGAPPDVVTDESPEEVAQANQGEDEGDDVEEESDEGEDSPQAPAAPVEDREEPWVIGGR